jgi:hypothetical protein
MGFVGSTGWFRRIANWAIVAGIVAFTPTAAHSADKRCLDEIYPAGTPRTTADFKFDQSFSGDADGSYSCFLGMRPSELRKALDRFRAAVLYRDSAAINAVVRFPLRAGVSGSTETNAPLTRITIRDAAEWLAFQDKYFSNTHTALVACAYLGNVTSTGGRSPGVMIGLGAFWFQSFVGDWTVKMTSVNIFPVDVAMLAKSCTPPGAEGN